MVIWQKGAVDWPLDDAVQLKMLSRAGSLLQLIAVNTNLVFAVDLLWERACSRRRWFSNRCFACHDAFADKPRSYSFVVCANNDL
ncbi:hypothetical protein AL066_20380 [Pseudomonas nunensis]|nr:hypothetical protein AL066_20380 [Pseudomonas nunensis]